MTPASLRHALATAAWLAAVTALGAWLAHFLYNGGMALADVARRKPINAPIDWLASLCREATFADIHRATLIGTTALASLPFLARLARNPDGPLRQEWTAARSDLPGLRQAALAIALCTTLSILIAWLFLGRSSITLPTTWARPILTAFLSALALETLFRGVLQRIFSATFRPHLAITFTATAYLLYLCALSPHDIASWSPALSSERFPLVRSLLTSLTNPTHAFGSSLPLLLLGIMLSWARTRSDSLWLGFGIQSSVLLSWHISPHPLPTILSALATLYVFRGGPSFRTATPS